MDGMRDGFVGIGDGWLTLLIYFPYLAGCSRGRTACINIGCKEAKVVGN